MTPSTSPEPVKSSKRKGTRSVSTLSAGQLQRKRANDREAQRAIRQRTKDTIDNLEKQVAELKANQNVDKRIQALLRRNKMLENENQRLKDKLRPSSAMFTTYDDGMNSASSTIPSPRTSPYPSGDARGSPYPSIEFGYQHPQQAQIPTQQIPQQQQQQQQQQQFVPQPAHYEPWTSTPHHGHSSVSSPASVATDDFVPQPNYMPTSMPANLDGRIPKTIKTELDYQQQGFPLQGQVQPNDSMPQPVFMQEMQDPWASPIYYPQQQHMHHSPAP